MMNKNFAILLFVLINLILCKSLFAQKSDIGNWWIYFGNQALNQKFNWHNEVQYRNYNVIGDMEQLLLRTGIGYNLTENNNNLLVGYGYIDSRNYLQGTDNTSSIVEHRIFQQFISRQKFGRFTLQHRYRAEERFIEDDFKMRFRYFLALNIALNRNTFEDKTLYASAYNEIFLNHESPVFDRNRLYGALGYVINEHFRVEVGFMSQILENTHRNQFQIVIFNNLPLFKKSGP